MDKENIERVLYAMMEDCGNLITKTEIKEILAEALIKIKKLGR